MKKTTFTIVTILVFTFLSCEKQEDSPIIENEAIAEGDQVVLDFIQVFNENNNNKLIVEQLKKSGLPVSLETMFSKISSSEKQAKFIQNASITKKSVHLEAYEFWLQKSSNPIRLNEILVAFAAENAEKLSTVTAFNLKGEKVLLNASTAPEVPVIVIDKNGFHALQLRAEAMNKELQKAGLQSKNAITYTRYRSFEKASLATTKLDKIELKDDQEPWIKGGAEIYAVTSGIRDAGNNPELKVIPMYYLDHDGDAYYPNQIMLFWDEYRYQAANIQLFEQDSNYNYQELLGIIIDGVAQIAGTLSGQSWINALGTIAGAIINALPDSWLTDDDDYVDSFYTIEKNKSYNNYYGASRNAKVNLSPFTVLEN